MAEHDTSVLRNIDWDKLKDMLDRGVSAYKRKVGNINIIVTGRTGTGKSTLINAVFGEDFAETAMGRPVTQTATWYEKPGHPLRILDTKGLETKDYAATRDTIKKEIAKGRSSNDANNHIHMGWVCVQEPAARFEEAEQQLVVDLKKADIPVIIVLTKHGMMPEFRATVLDLAPEADAVVQVRAIAGPGFPTTHGLDALVNLTFQLVPKGVQIAFASAQVIDIEMKRSVARKEIAVAAAAAGAAAVIPVPFSDAFTIVPIQIGMIVAISHTFGILGDSGSMAPLAASMIGCVVTTAAGRLIVGQLLKLVPFGGVVNAGVAASLTTALGEAYVAFLSSFHAAQDRMPTIDEIGNLFKDFWQQKAPKFET